MGSETNVPPKIPVREVQRYARELARRRAGLQEGDSERESLPVLEAFQQFLDTERRRSRNRVLAVAGLCVFMLLVAAGGMLIAGALMLDDIGASVERLRQRLELVGSAAADQLKEAEASMGSLRRDFESLRGEVTGISAAATGDSTAIFSNVLAGLQVELSGMVAENLRLRSDLEGLRSAWSNQLAATSGGPSAPTGGGSGIRVSELPPVEAVRKPGQGRRPPLALAIRPPEESRPVRWLVPIPE